MKLSVLGDESTWYEQGLKFTCTQCGNCCTGGPGFVWISREEVVRLADYLHLTPSETVEQYCRTINGQLSINEKGNRSGSFDCVFLVERMTPPGDGDDQTIRQPTRGCAIYPVRPLQCRTWPFWPENLETKEAWHDAERKCPGMDQGKRYSRPQIEAIRDAADWPKPSKTPGSRRK